MEHFFVHFAQTAAWLLGIILILAIVGVIAIIQWIVNAVRGTERAVEGGVRNVEGRFHGGGPEKP